MKPGDKVYVCIYEPHHHTWKLSKVLENRYLLTVLILNKHNKLVIITTCITLLYDQVYPHADKDQSLDTFDEE
jgi:hypothetical protein